MITVKKFVFNPFYENTYIVYDNDTREAAVIDPGCYDDIEKKKLMDTIDENQLIIKYLVNTHCHIDHIFGNSFIKEKYNPVFIAPEEDFFLLDLMVEQGNLYGTPLSPSPNPDQFITESMKFCLGNLCGKFLHVPGHSPGGYCLYFGSEKICFTGDVLFKGSVGRTDLWRGDFDILIKSIRDKLFTLPDDVKILPGHESYSTIGYEKSNNQFLV
jgi:glyoxylase-like metal-dependent hydrolase (beta-lactamase superfamily II)